MKALTLPSLAPVVIATGLLFSAAPVCADQPQNPLPARQAAEIVNALALDLLRADALATGNVLFSPYSLQVALAMSYAGAEGVTRDEMSRVLHYPPAEESLHTALLALQLYLARIEAQTTAQAEQARHFGGPAEPVQWHMANRLFGQEGYAFRKSFLKSMQDTYQAPLHTVDFKRDAESARQGMNQWVAGETQDKIRDLIPPGVLTPHTRMVLVNAVYLRAPWQQSFNEQATRPSPFHLQDGREVRVATMTQRDQLGYAKTAGYEVVTVLYAGGGLQLLVILPEPGQTLSAVESSLTLDALSAAALAPKQQVQLYLPKLHLEPRSVELGKVLRSLGMTTAFDEPQRSANFDRLAPRRLPHDYLYIAEVFHKAFLNLDEKGTEAAAATAVIKAVPVSLNPAPPSEPTIVRVDRPFLFAVQHRSSGTCLFIGRVADPR
jgi:serpin B